MFKILEYYSRFEGIRGTYGGMPGWARLILAIVALPGIVLLGLSILAFGVSLLALLLLTVPVYRVLMAVTGGGNPPVEREYVAAEEAETPARRHVDVKIIEEPRP